MASKKQDRNSSHFINDNTNYSNKEKMYRWSDRSRYNYVRKPEYNQNMSYTRYRPYYEPYYRTNETHFKRKNSRKPPSRPSSPTLGSEEYMVKKIQQTSAIIMKHLLNPDESIPENSKNVNDTEENKKDHNEIPNKKSNKTKGKSGEVNDIKSRNTVTYNIEEIQKKIMCHITNLNDGKKKNLVFSNTSSYDIAIQQIQKQKRLEISRALRNMCSQSKTQESSDFINSIIPDIGIKIEDLPRDVIEELSNTLNLDCGSYNYEEDFANSFSQDNCYIPFNDTQLCGATKDDSVKEASNTQSSKEEHSNEELLLTPKKELDDTQNNGNIETITIKKEIEEYPDTPHITPNESDGNHIENNIQVKQEKDLYPDFEQHNGTVFHETSTNLGLNCSETAANSQNHNRFGYPLVDVSTQTNENDICPTQTFIENFLESNFFNQPPKCISEAVTRMLKIDECIMEMTKYRQTLFNSFNDTNQLSKDDELSVNNSPEKVKKKKRKKNKITSKETCSNNTHVAKKIRTDESKNHINQQAESNTSGTDNPLNNNNKSNLGTENNKEVNLPKKVTKKNTQKKTQSLLNLQDINEKILTIKAVEDKLVAGSENGNIFTFSLSGGECVYTFHPSDVPITAILFEKTKKTKINMYVGSFENNLKVYNFQNQSLVKTIFIDDSIQCLEWCWGYIFMGCIRGSMIRYSIKKGMIDYEDKWADDRILVLKATQEGARRILLVASRNSPVCIRDAMTGLYMRIMENIVTPTVYSLIMEKSMIYCGTTTHDILVYSFHDGKLCNTLVAAGAKGISCLKINKNLLFASCHNGCIYVYDMKNKIFVDKIQGPGGIILSMEVLENQVIIGTISSKFVSLPIPPHILECNK